MNNSAFDSWYNGVEGFHINSERIIYDLYSKEGAYPDAIALRRWMAVCWNNALEAAQALPEIVFNDFAYDQVETLKETI